MESLQFLDSTNLTSGPNRSSPELNLTERVQRRTSGWK